MNYILKTACVQSQNVSLHNYYYVNEDGVRLTNQWVSFENEDDETDGSPKACVAVKVIKGDYDSEKHTCCFKDKTPLIDRFASPERATGTGHNTLQRYM